ncbi:MAG: Uma2 family endonuclease [Candidatus Methylomirabilales bacterium]
MGVQVAKRRFTVEEYHRMGAAGIFSEDDRVELIEGEIVEMSPIGRRHAACVKRLIRLFDRGVGDRAIVGAQDPIRLGEHSEPQPDLTLLRPRPDFYAHAHPGPEDVFLIVEAAETSADYDRELKIPLYARAGIPEVWVVELDAERIEVYRKPGPHGYQEVQTVRRGPHLSPQAFPELALASDDILG